MFGNPRFLLDRETSKPKSASQTLARLAGHFKPFWPALLLVAVLMVVSTWAQVTTPELTGQIVDCYLAPAAASTSTFEGSPLVEDAARVSESSCWLATDVEADGITQTLIKGAAEALNISGFR